MYFKNIYAHKSCKSKAQNMLDKVYNLECVSVNDLHLDTQSVKTIYTYFHNIGRDIETILLLGADML